MEILEHTATWIKGDVLQGRIMLGIGILLLAFPITILTNQNALLKGMLIPLSLVILIMVGYGSVLSFGRPGHLTNVKKSYAENQQQTMDQELQKAEKDNKSYSTLKPIWVALIIVSALTFYFFKTEYLKGLSIGLISLFLTALIVDATLHHRLKPYLQNLKLEVKQ